MNVLKFSSISWGGLYVVRETIIKPLQILKEKNNSYMCSKMKIENIKIKQK